MIGSGYSRTRARNVLYPSFAGRDGRYNARLTGRISADTVPVPDWLFYSFGGFVLGALTGRALARGASAGSESLARYFEEKAGGRYR